MTKRKTEDLVETITKRMALSIPFKSPNNETEFLLREILKTQQLILELIKRDCSYIS